MQVGILRRVRQATSFALLGAGAISLVLVYTGVVCIVPRVPRSAAAKRPMAIMPSSAENAAQLCSVALRGAQGTAIVTTAHPSDTDSAAQSEAVTNAAWLLSTLMQVDAAIAAITIPLLFLVAQLSSRPRHSRLVAELYSGLPQLFVLCLFLVALFVAGVGLATVGQIVRRHQLWLLDVNLVLSGTALASLVPLVMLQIESLNPYHLGVAIATRITPRRIRRFRLVRATRGGRSERVSYQLVPWNRERSIADPLGAFHELVVGAVEAHDRIQVEILTRLLLQRVARCCGVPYRVIRSGLPYPAGIWGPPIRRLWIWTHCPASDVSRVITTVHIMHYVVRRAVRLRGEWGDLDPIRQHFVASIVDLIEVAAIRPGNAQIIDICLMAAMRIGLAYADVKREGREEPWARLYGIAVELRARGLEAQAMLTLGVLAAIAVRTRQLPEDQCLLGSELLGPALHECLSAKVMAAHGDDKWCPAPAEGDPWAAEAPSHITA